MGFLQGIASRAALTLQAASKSLGAWGAGSAYDAARQGRRLGNWRPTSAHINTVLAWSGTTLRDRTRDLVRNNPYVRSAVETYVANAVASGIKPSSLVVDSAKKNEIRQAWSDWTDEADADGLTDFYGLETLVARAEIDAGECFIRRRPRRPDDGLSVPLQIQLIEADQLPLEDNRTLDNGNLVRSGIEFDAIGRRQAYWFWRRHPGDLTDQRGIPQEQVRVPASEVLHVFRPRRPGQIRGEPELIAAMVRLYLLDQYEDAELERKKIAAMFTVVVTQEQPEEPDPTADTDADGTERDHVQPGTTNYLLPGEKVEIPPPADVGPNFEAFMLRALLAACAAMGVPYFAVTGDLRQANYSSLRAGTVEFRTRLEQFQHQTMVFQFGRMVWQWFLDAAVLSGALQLPGYARDPAPWRRAKWISPKLPWVDPQKDITAEKLAVDAGFKSRSDVIEGQGEDPEEVDQRIAQDKEREKRLGLDFSSQSTPSASAAGQPVGGREPGDQPEDSQDQPAAPADAQDDSAAA